jgi:NitT/TauT family transport system ATP-binding protein
MEVAGLAAKSPSLPLIEMKDVSIQFGALPVLDRIRLTIGEGQFISLLGPSGCGKSTLLKAIGGLVPVSGGAIEIGPGARRLGLMFQKPLLLPWRTALSNVCLPLELGHKREGLENARERALRMLELVRLQDFAQSYPHQLSGGMQQRVALARTLVQDPDVLLLDEPFGALDELTRDLLNEELIGIWRSGATRLTTIVMVTHSIPEAVAMSDRVFVLAPRPARLLETADIPLPYPRHAEDPRAARIIAHIRQLVRGAL